jgi:hypothetical protein
MERNEYWVKYKNNHWTTMNKNEDGVWWSGSFTWDDDDALKAEGYTIGPRIPSPEELAEKDTQLTKCEKSGMALLHERGVLRELLDYAQDRLMTLKDTEGVAQIMTVLKREGLLQ